MGHVSSGAGLIATAVVASAQSVPTARDQVARPGGQVPGLPALALVKVADGFNDPVGVSVGERRHRPHLRRRAGRAHQGRRQGRARAARAVPGPHQDEPARVRGADGLRRAGPLVGGVPPEVQGQRPHLRALRVAAVQRGLDRRPLHRRPRQPGPDHHGAGEQDGEGDHEHPAAVLQPLRRDDRLRAGRVPVRRQGRRRMGGRPPGCRPASRPPLGQDAPDRRGRARHRAVPDPADQPAGAGRPGSNDVAVRRDRGGLLEDPDGGATGDLGLWAAQPVHVPLRPAERRPLHRRRRTEPLGGDQLPAARRARGARTTAGATTRHRTATP